MTSPETAADLCVDAYLPGERFDPASLPDPAIGAPTSSDELALARNRRWQPGQELRIRFLDGDPRVHERVAEHAVAWLDHAHLGFAFGNHAAAEIRVSFTGTGYWSYVGTDAMSVHPAQPTMQLGGFTVDTDEVVVRRTVLHEFGHAIGCVHEQASPAAAFEWDEERVYAFYEEWQGWDRPDVDHNVLMRYGNHDTHFSAHDRDSIMQYPVPAGLTRNGVTVGWNNELSDGDRSFIALMYPEEAARIMRPGPEQPGLPPRATDGTPLPAATADGFVCLDSFVPPVRRTTSGGAVATARGGAGDPRRYWATGTVLRVRFLDGPGLAEEVLRAAAAWTEHANLRFEQVSAGPAEIRVTFEGSGNWSMVGTDALVTDFVAPDMPTMSLAEIRSAISARRRERVIRHEFGHAIGLLHRHHSPSARISWNKPVVYAALTAPPNNWTRQMVDENVFRTSGGAANTFATFDDKSIMMYPIPPEWTLDGRTFPESSVISAGDAAFVRTAYPGCG